MRTRCLLCLLAIAALLLTACGAVAEPGEDLVARGGASPGEPAPPPPAPDAVMSLWLSASEVPPGPAELVTVLVNHTGVQATFGVAATVDRWEDGSWVPHRQLVMCMDHWYCTAEMEPTGVDLETQSIGLSATLDQVGPTERFSTGGLEVGWYRVNQEANEGIVASGVFEVAGGAAPPAPLVPVDDPAISVSPPVVAPSSEVTVTLSPLIPAPSGSQTLGEVTHAVAGLSETAALQRWDGSAWEPVADIALVPPGPDASALDRSADLPALEDGEYRLVRSGPDSDHIGHFWVGSTEVRSGAQTPEAPVEGEWSQDDHASEAVGTTSTTSRPSSGTQVDGHTQALDRVTVTLWHCGIDPLSHDGRAWEVPVNEEPFDQTNAPARFTGSGTVERPTPDELVYTDDSGIKLRFVPAELVEHPPCA